ncbi:hypothetical protein BH11PSE5_BH11PSE5_20970 [soil metagenome]
MVSKASARIVIDTLSQTSEIFSVRERNDGNLIISFRRPDEMGDPLVDVYSKVLDVRISIHVSPASTGHTFVHHIRQADGTYSKFYAKVEPSHGRFIWPLLGSSSADLSQARYLAPPVDGERRISLGKYNPQFGTLLYFVIITNAGLPMRAPHQLNSQQIDFAAFSVHVFWGFLQAPSFHQGNIIHMVQGWTIEHPQGQSSHKVIEFAPTWNRGQLASLLKKLSTQFILVHEAKLTRYLVAQGANANEIQLDQLRGITRSPLMLDED